MFPPPAVGGGRWLRPQPFFVNVYIRVSMAITAAAALSGVITIAVTVAVVAAAATVGCQSATMTSAIFEKNTNSHILVKSKPPETRFLAVSNAGQSSFSFLKCSRGLCWPLWGARGSIYSKPQCFCHCQPHERLECRSQPELGPNKN